jgi:hypothetical protein
MIDFTLAFFVIGLWLLGFVTGLLVRSGGWRWWRRS